MDLRQAVTRLLPRTTVTHALSPAQSDLARANVSGRRGGIDALPSSMQGVCGPIFSFNPPLLQGLRFRIRACLFYHGISDFFQDSRVIARQFARFQIKDDYGQSQRARPITCVRQFMNSP